MGTLPGYVNYMKTTHKLVTSNHLFNRMTIFIFCFKFILKFQIKFLKTKEGTAMVQMGDSVAVERCVQHLNNIPVGDKGKLQIALVFLIAFMILLILEF